MAWLAMAAGAVEPARGRSYTAMAEERVGPVSASSVSAATFSVTSLGAALCVEP
jgi:hypothetical protein